MNTGQRLAQMSGLGARPAIEHLRVIQAGLGTVFSSRFSVVLSEDRFSVVRKAKRQASKPEAVPRQDQQPKATNGKALFAVARANGIAVLTQADSLTITQSTQSVVAATDLGTITVNRKRKSI